MKIPPPKNALKFLRWFCREDYIEEIEGDLTEVFENQVEQSPRKAKVKFGWSVLKYFRPEFIKSFRSKYKTNPTIMFRHNLLITYRNFLKYKSSFFINLTGLSSGLACALLVCLWVMDEQKVDKFHENDRLLYQVKEHVEQGGGIITRFTTSGPTAEVLQNEMPEVDFAVMTTDQWGRTYVVSANNNDIKTSGIYASLRFFEMFTYPLIHGDRRQVLSDKKSIVISESLCRRLFGTVDDVVGKTIEWQHWRQYHVTGVFKDIPANASVRFDFVLTFEEFIDDNPWAKTWFSTAPQTYVLMKEGFDPVEFNRKIGKLVKTKTEGKASHRTPFITRYSDEYLYGHYENGIRSGGRIEYVRMFSIIAIFILLIACINFMNLSTARASRRMKEVGMKKAIGARQGGLVVQYLSESGFMAFLSMVIALLIVMLLLPQFNDITDKQLRLNFNLTFVSTLIGIVLVTGLVAGSYPALYLSNVNSIAILRGKLKGFIGEVWVRKGLVVFQFTLSIVLIVSVWVVYNQIEFVQTRNLGYSKDNVILVPREGAVWNKLDAFLTEVERIPGVVAASSSGHDMTGHNGGTYGVEWPGKDQEDRTEFERVSANYGLVELLNIEMKEGRTFSRSFGADSVAIILNQAAINFMGMKDPIGKVIKYDGMDMHIIGVTKDFHFESFHEELKPLFFILNPRHTSHIMVKIEAGKEQETIARLEQFHREFNPGFPFDYKFLDADYQKLYAAEHRVGMLSRYFAGIAILISCLGLFALAAFTAERRVKEIGIRKILGSSEQGIVYLLSSDFTRMVIIAIVLALPLSYFMVTQWLAGFAFRIDLEWWFFAGAGLSALLIAWLTIGVQTFKAARVNPAECLRSE